MLWLLQTVMVAPPARLRPFGPRFGFGHGRIIVLLVILLVAVVIAVISHRNRR